MSDTKTLKAIDIARIMELLPHRYPFLLVDRIIDMDADQSCVGVKNVTINEPFFQGHFPSRPVMPGVLLIEAMARPWWNREDSGTNRQRSPSSGREGAGCKDCPASE